MLDSTGSALQSLAQKSFGTLAQYHTRTCSSPPLHLVSSLLKNPRRHVDRNPICPEASMSIACDTKLHANPSLSFATYSSSLDTIFQTSQPRFMCRQSHQQFQCQAMDAYISCKPYLQAYQHAGSPESYMGKHGAGPDGLRGRKGRRGTWHDICLQEVRGISCFTSTRPGTVKVTLSAAKRSSLRGKSLPQGETDT